MKRIAAALLISAVVLCSGNSHAFGPGVPIARPPATTTYKPGNLCGPTNPYQECACTVGQPCQTSVGTGVCILITNPFGGTSTSCDLGDTSTSNSSSNSGTLWCCPGPHSTCQPVSVINNLVQETDCTRNTLYSLFNDQGSCNSICQ